MRPASRTAGRNSCIQAFLPAVGRTGVTSVGSMIRAVLVTAVAVAVLAGCGADDAAAPQPTPTLVTAAPTLPTTSTVVTTPPTSATTATTAADRATTTVVVVAPTAPDTTVLGVPGGSSDLPMCRDYSAVVGTQSVLTLAGAFGGLDATALARLELIAAPTVIGAADALASEWPSDLAGEEQAVMTGVVGPILERAQLAGAALAGTGIDPVVLDTVWQDVLANYDPARPAVTVTDLDAATESALAATASAYAATTTRYDLDGSVLRTVATPLTSQYLFDNCPELSYLITGDAD